MALQWMEDGPADARICVILAHGAGAPMDSPAMTAATDALASRGFRVLRFEFAYMAERRSGTRKPPPKAEKLAPEFEAALAEICDMPMIIGGKSMGGRVASIIGDDLYAAGKILGLLCLGYPFHPPGRPERLRTAHLKDLKVPALICQGTRDPFGSRDEVGDYDLSSTVEIFWLEDGDHDLKPRKSVSGLTAAHHMGAMADRVHAWADTLLRQ